MNYPHLWVEIICSIYTLKSIIRNALIRILQFTRENWSKSSSSNLFWLFIKLLIIRNEHQVLKPLIFVLERFSELSQFLLQKSSHSPLESNLTFIWRNNFIANEHNIQHNLIRFEKKKIFFTYLSFNELVNLLRNCNILDSLLLWLL